MNLLDVYLGTGLEVKPARLEQFANGNYGVRVTEVLGPVRVLGDNTVSVMRVKSRSFAALRMTALFRLPDSGVSHYGIVLLLYGNTTVNVM